MRVLTAPMKTPVAVAVRTTAVALLAAMSVGAAVAADDDVAWAVRTAANHFGAERTSFDYTLDPGGQVEDALVVANHGTTPLELAVYAADGYTADSGQLDLVAKDVESTGIGAWVGADADSVTVQPGASAEVPFTVDVPDDATPGDYAGGIVTSLLQQDDAEGINVDRRLGIRINLHVGGDLAPSLAIEQLHATYVATLNPFAKGAATVTYTIHNTGNTVLSAQQAASVSGPFGWLRVDASDAADAPPQLLPGESWTVSTPVRGVAPLFRVSATATLVPLLTDASGSTSSLEAVQATTHSWAIPWMLLLLVALLAGGVTGARLLARRARVQRKASEDARVHHAVEQALREREVTVDTAAIDNVGAPPPAG